MKKYLKEKLKPIVFQLLQIVLLIVCFLIAFIFNLEKIIKSIISNYGLNVSEIGYYLLAKMGNIFIGISLLVIVLFFLINRNKNKILNASREYYDYKYGWFWFCSKILGYKKCLLINIPIHMQYKLVINKTFDEYLFDNELIQEVNLKPKIKYKNIKKDNNSNEYCLILEDTYEIKNLQLPKEKSHLFSIKIIRDDEKSNNRRIYSPDFVQTIFTEVSSIPEGSIIYVFATTNAKHNYEIAKKVFSQSDRGNLKAVYVYQQEKEKGRMFKKPYKVY